LNLSPHSYPYIVATPLTVPQSDSTWGMDIKLLLATRRTRTVSHRNVDGFLDNIVWDSFDVPVGPLVA